jgi:hypothetical protein
MADELTINIDDGKEYGEILLESVTDEGYPNRKPQTMLELGVWHTLSGEYVRLNKDEVKQLLKALDNWVSFGRLKR